MNDKFKVDIQERIDSFDQSMLAEIFNIYASDYDNIEFYLNQDETYVFNILDNKQASRAVAKFGFETVAKAANEDWIIYAKKSENGKWEFSNKSPGEAVSEHLENIICDIISRPKEYPSWVIDEVSPVICQLVTGWYDKAKVNQC